MATKTKDRYKKHCSCFDLELRQRKEGYLPEDRCVLHADEPAFRARIKRELVVGNYEKLGLDEIADYIVEAIGTMDRAYLMRSLQSYDYWRSFSGPGNYLCACSHRMYQHSNFGCVEGCPCEHVRVD